MIQKIIIALTFLWSFSLTNSIAQFNENSLTPNKPIDELIDEYILSYPEYDKFSGVVLVTVRDKILFEKAYGYASIELEKRNTVDGKFAIGSFSKVFTATLVLKMCELELINLDATINEYLNYYPKETGSKITIRQLLNNTSGIPQHITAYSNFWTDIDNYYHTPKQLINLFSSLPLLHEPGEKYTYSSPGYYVLGAILEQVTKKSYAELVKEYILEPLNMKGTMVDNSIKIIPGMACGYQRGLEGLIKSNYEDQSTAFAAGDLVSNVKDLFLWTKFLTMKGDEVLTKESKEILLGLPDEDSRFSKAGIPVLRLKADNKEAYQHLVMLSGSSSGYIASMYRFIEEDLCIIVLSNVSDTDVSTITDHISDFVTRYYLKTPIGQEAPLSITPFKSAEISSKNIQKNLGFYKGEGKSITGIVKEGNKIYQLVYSNSVQIQKAMELTPLEENLYILGYLPFFKCRFNFDTDDGIPTMETLINERQVNIVKQIRYEEKNIADFTGPFTSVELQRTYRIITKNNLLIWKGFLNKKDYHLTPLDQDLFGFEKGFIEFFRDDNQNLIGFNLITRDTDAFFRSKFIKK